ncbi:methyltransferase domain protein [Synechococcus sp. A15-62]|uniref:class I SAM-dependent methyltransferase n=1 Tax=Synechococcus sp. A15-62 TaxID=1050657 RepID=UPI001648C5CD|nr:class I SAM-dependent methyltransferase [Synechococcus sp. A15-62]QNJ00612.1 methyltransferase domain protein [Synechococcus sp. A15-62]
MNNSFLYDEFFYDDQVARSYESANIYIFHLLKYFRPSSIIDVGCGRGTWLKAFEEHGATRCVGLDGVWNSQKKMLSNTIKFYPTDLSQPSFPVDSDWDLAMSLEVAEHLPESSSDNFVEFLTSLSDVVLFSAAFSNQGGDNHINEQLHSYWALKFLHFGFVPFDLFRPFFWGNSSVDFCYRQNTFLYVSTSSSLHNVLVQAGINPIDHIEFMNCVHPYLYLQRSSISSIVTRSIASLIPLSMMPFVRSLMRRLRR